MTQTVFFEWAIRRDFLGERNGIERNRLGFRKVLETERRSSKE